MSSNFKAQGVIGAGDYTEHGDCPAHTETGFLALHNRQRGYVAGVTRNSAHTGHVILFLDWLRPGYTGKLAVSSRPS